MSRRIIHIALLSLLFVSYSFAQNDSVAPAKAKAHPAIYQGTILKLDIASSVLVPATTKWKMQHYEIAANVRLKNRFYPTLELGYAGGMDTQGDTVTYNGKGGFVRLGCDINPLKKRPESPHALLLGIRIGTAVQGYEQDASRESVDNAFSYDTGMKIYRSAVKADCWGEIVVGCQVEIVSGKKPVAKGQLPMALYMGWMGRLKILFTREKEGLLAEDMGPIYIPGFGSRDNISWGFSYHIGWRF